MFKQMFIPTTQRELKKLGWNQLDIILISGDSYIDSPYDGVAVLGKLLISEGYKVGIISQPDINYNEDIKRLGEPKLFWGITGGCVDSMVANYTAVKKKRKSDDFTPGGINNRRPDRAVIAYTNLVRRNFKDTVPIVIGGIEASLRRVVHYDYWSNKLRRSILFDSKADILVYGMGEISILQLAENLKNKDDYTEILGICHISKEPKSEYIELPTFEECKNDKYAFIKMFNKFYENNDPVTAEGLYQKHGDRFLIQNPPQSLPTQDELDSYYDLEFELKQHPFYEKMGKVKAMDTIQFSSLTHRGCYGECNFCAIAVHQGKTVVSRSEKSILDELESYKKHNDFKGIVKDIGGPTANMYGYECRKKMNHGTCKDKRCIEIDTCPALKPNHGKVLSLLRKARQIKGIKKIFVASGIRYDLIVDDKLYGEEYLEEVVKNHTSGQMKIAPEHTENNILHLMGKPGKKYLLKFRDLFYQFSKKAGKKQFLTYYLIAAHPGCTEKDMENLKKYSMEKLKAQPEQVQIFTPTPSTYSTLMYYTEINPFTNKKIFVEKDINRMNKQKSIITEKKKFQKNRKRKNKSY